MKQKERTKRNELCISQIQGNICRERGMYPRLEKQSSWQQQIHNKSIPFPQGPCILSIWSKPYTWWENLQTHVLLTMHVMTHHGPTSRHAFSRKVEEWGFLVKARREAWAVMSLKPAKKRGSGRIYVQAHSTLHCTLYNNKISFYLLCMWKRGKWYDGYCTFRSLLYRGWNVGVAYKSDRMILNKQTGKRSAHVKYLQKLHTASKNTVVIKHIFFVFYLAAGGPIKISHETLK